jgi:hypothetical protein
MAIFSSGFNRPNRSASLSRFFVSMKVIVFRSLKKDVLELAQLKGLDD